MTTQIEYRTSVYTEAAGWRSVTVTAEAEVNATGKMARVGRVTAIDGETPDGYTSRTGARRQRYNAAGVARREEGKRKRLSACEILEPSE